MSSLKVDERGARKSSWHFVVSETVRHTRGHTVYRVTLQVIPVDVSESIREFVWWKRYSDFQVLHKTLAALHAALYLKGNFPAFPKPVILRRHEEQVIEERRQAAVKLLNFISEYPILCRNDVMKEFLTGGEEVFCSSDLDATAVLRPQKLHLLEQAQSDSIDDFLSGNSSEAGTPREASLSPVGGIWEHRQDDSLSPDSSPVEGSGDAVCAELALPGSIPAHPDISEAIPTYPDAFLDDGVIFGEDFEKMAPKSGKIVLSTDHSRLFEDVAADANRDGLTESGKGDGFEEDYLFIAGHHLARANDKELAGEFEVSFGLYKLGIDILLRGVQSDKDPVRRDAVRRKAAKYLAKAEQLYNDCVSGNLNDMIDPLTDSAYSTAAGIRAELSEYTVVSVLDEKVSLVMHKTTHETLIMKVLSKSATSSAGKARDRRTIIPLGQPRQMVQLRRFIETDDSVYMILERAPGGRLLDYITKSISVADEKRGGLRKIDSASSELSRTSSGDFSTSWRKLVVTMATADADPTATGNDDYADLFFRHALDSDRSRRASLAQVGRPSLTTPISIDSGHIQLDDTVFESLEENGQGDWVADFSATSAPETGDLIDISDAIEVARPDMEFLQSVEPSASPTLRGLVNWRNVSELDSDQLVAKSKELLQSLDRTIQSTKEVFPTPNATSPSRTPSSGPSDLMTSLPEKRISNQEIDSKLEDSTFEDSTEEVALKKMPETLVRVWAAELIVAVESLHDLGIVCLDLDLHNVLLGEKGHVKLTYFSQWQSVQRSLPPLTARHAHHIAPELRKVGEAAAAVCDTWSIGMIVFQLLTGQRFDVWNPVAVHSHRSLVFPADLSQEGTDLVRKMLKVNPRERLSLPEVRLHPWFSTVDWVRIQNGL